MKTENGEAEFIAEIRRKLDERIDRLDAHQIMRLRRARLQALQSRRPSRPARRSRLRWGVAAVAVGLLLTATTLFTPHFTTESSTPVAVSGVEDLELLSASENPDFFSDLDFYAWLAEEMDHEV